MDQNYAVIVDNGGGPNLVYYDEIGKFYTFPSSYQKYLRPGTKVIYARSGKKSEDDKLDRMMDEAHYFGMAEIGDVYPTEKKNLRATIINYQQFRYPVPFNNNGSHLETADGMFWRNGVRPITGDIYNRILSSSTSAPIITRSSCSDRGKRTTRTLNDIKLISAKFADEQFQVVTAKDGYYLLSLSDGIYYKLTGEKGLCLDSGVLKVLTNNIINHYAIRHVLNTSYVEVGQIDLERNSVDFDKNRLFDGTIKIKA